MLESLLGNQVVVQLQQVGFFLPSCSLFEYNISSHAHARTSNTRAPHLSRFDWIDYRHPAHTGHGLNASCWFVRRCIQAIAWMHPGFGGNIQAWPECIPPFYYVNVGFWAPKCDLAWINPDAFRPWPECTPFTFRHLLLICPAMHSGHGLNTPGDGSTNRLIANSTVLFIC